MLIFPTQSPNRGNVVRSRIGNFEVYHASSLSSYGYNGLWRGGNLRPARYIDIDIIMLELSSANNKQGRKK